MGLLNNKVAFVTGGASGIGASAVQRFAREGACVAIADLEEGQAVSDALFVRCDVRDPESVQQALDATVEKWGRHDIVFANAGIPGVWTSIEEMHPAEWDNTLTTNLKGTFLTVHHAIPHLRKAGGGSIIITSSVSGSRTFGQPGAVAYSTSKAAQIAFMKMAALELGRYNIRVNAVCPGAIPTNIGQRLHKRDTDEIAINVQLPEGNPALHHGVGEAVDVADTCLFLASDLSRHVSGVAMYVDGGASLLN